MATNNTNTMPTTNNNETLNNKTLYQIAYGARPGIQEFLTDYVTVRLMFYIMAKTRAHYPVIDKIIKMDSNAGKSALIDIGIGISSFIKYESSQKLGHTDMYYTLYDVAGAWSKAACKIGVGIIIKRYMHLKGNSPAIIANILCEILASFLHRRSKILQASDLIKTILDYYWWENQGMSVVIGVLNVLMKENFGYIKDKFLHFMDKDSKPISAITSTSISTLADTNHMDTNPTTPPNIKLGVLNIMLDMTFQYFRIIVTKVVTTKFENWAISYLHNKMIKSKAEEMVGAKNLMPHPTKCLCVTDLTKTYDISLYMMYEYFCTTTMMVATAKLAISSLHNKMIKSKAEEMVGTKNLMPHPTKCLCVTDLTKTYDISLYMMYEYFCTTTMMVATAKLAISSLHNKMIKPKAEKMVGANLPHPTKCLCVTDLTKTQYNHIQDLAIKATTNGICYSVFSKFEIAKLHELYDDHQNFISTTKSVEEIAKHVVYNICSDIGTSDHYAYLLSHQETGEISHYIPCGMNSIS